MHFQGILLAVIMPVTAVAKGVSCEDSHPECYFFRPPWHLVDKEMYKVQDDRTWKSGQRILCGIRKPGPGSICISAENMKKPNITGAEIKELWKVLHAKRCPTCGRVDMENDPGYLKLDYNPRTDSSGAYLYHCVFFHASHCIGSADKKVSSRLFPVSSSLRW